MSIGSKRADGRFRKGNLGNLPKDEPLSRFAFDRSGLVLPIGQDHGIDDLATAETSPPVKVECPRIITEVLKWLMDHATGTPWASHRGGFHYFHI
jgi:hypothetical protein